MNPQIELLEQAEASVLAAALASESHTARVVATLDEQDFRREGHRSLFRAVAACARDGRYGTVEVTSWLIDHNLIGQVGGPAEVSRLGTRSTAGFDGRLGRVQSARRRRKLLEAANSLVDAATDWQTSDDELRQLVVGTLLDAEASAGTAQVVTASDLKSEVYNILQAGTSSRAVSTGWKQLDRHYRPAPGRWTLVGGIPGHGKSTVLDALVHNLAVQHGWRTFIVSPEKQPIEQHVAQLIQLQAGRPILQRGVPAAGDDIDGAFGWVDDHFSWLELGDDGRDVGSLLAMARLEHARRPFQGMVVDPWNELDHSRDRNLSETEHISQSLTRIREFARRLDVHVWLVAHPTKMTAHGDGMYPVPTPYDVSGSAHWRNKADNALAVWRDPRSPGSPSQVHVQKVRFQPDDGREGIVELSFDASTGRFEDRSPV